MMPHDGWAWLFFLYFAVGSLGGWIIIVSFVYEAWRMRKRNDGK